MNIPAALLVGGIAIAYVIAVLPRPARRGRPEEPRALDPLEPRTALDDAPRDRVVGESPLLPDIDVSDGSDAD